MNKPILAMRNISKSFPGVMALNNVSFSLLAGEVHVLMGENGAGKSTLMKILAGIYPKDHGEIEVDGQLIRGHYTPREALQKGISMIHQELSPIPEMTIAENIYLAREPKLLKIGLVNRKVMHAQAAALFQQLGVELNPKTKMKALSVAQMQMVEIAKAVSYNSKIVIMDEPTSAITDKEVETLFQTIAMIKARGVGVVYISHKMDEIMRVGDRITVLRDGEYVATRPLDEVDKSQIIAMMVGREISSIFPKINVTPGQVVMSVKGLTSHGAFANISFDLKAGEILGIAGLMGAGRTEVVERLFGVGKIDAGEIHIHGKPVAITNPMDAIRHGIALVSEDRKKYGLNLKFSVKENISLVKLRDFCVGGVIRKQQEIAAVDALIQKIRIKTPSRNQTALNLSGGNQQKVVIAKWLLAQPQILIMDEPTRGIDVGAKMEIHGLISALAKEGKAIIMISSELPEIIGMSDRVLVMHEGKMMGMLARHELHQETIMKLATGHQEE